MENLPTRVVAGEFVLGVDVSKAMLTCALQDPDQAFVAAEFANDTAGIREVQSCVSAVRRSQWRPRAGPVRDLARARALLVNSARAHSFHRAFNERNKADRIDVRMLCRYARQILSRAREPPRPYTACSRTCPSRASA